MGIKRHVRIQPTLAAAIAAACLVASSSAVLVGPSLAASGASKPANALADVLPVSVTVPPPPSPGMWLTQKEILARPMSGPAWNALTAAANATWPKPKISDQENQGDVAAMGGALYYARTGDAAMRTKVRKQIMAAMGTERGGRILALGRNVVGYVLAADLINLRDYSRPDDVLFRAWLAAVLIHRDNSCDTIIICHEMRPNNWGTAAGASRIAADIYLGNTTDLARAAAVFHGWLGDRSAYSGFYWGSNKAALSWQCDPAAPVGINPAGCTRAGHSLDGVLPDELRRAGTYRWKPPKENYVYAGLQGAVVQAALLSRQKYDAWNWCNKAIKRAFTWLNSVDLYPAEGDDGWQPWLVNAAYGTNFPAPAPAEPGKNAGFTDWTHAG